jgi:hypothetical protein
VLRREAVLDEHAITQRNGGRRISTVLQLDGDLSSSGGGGDDGDIELSIVGSGAVVDHRNPMRRPASSGTDASNAELKKEVALSKKEIALSKKEIALSKKEIAYLKKTVARLMKHLSLTPSNGEAKIDDPARTETTAISIKDIAPTTTLSNPHWKKLKHALKTVNAFSQKNKRVKRLSTVMKARRNSAVGQEAIGDMSSTTTTTAAPVAPDDIEMHIDENTGRRYSYNTTNGETAWLDE